MRLAYAITTALVAGASVATLALQSPVTAQTDTALFAASAPRAGAPGSFADLVEKLQPAVVNIATKERVQVSANPFAGTPLAEMFGNQLGQGGEKPITREAQSLGSGFIISSDGYIVTNNHVISGHAGQSGVNSKVSSITVILPDRREFTAKLIGKDPTSDLAVLKIDATGLPFVRFGDSTKARVGDWVVAIGQPLGLQGTVTAGIISAIHRNVDGGPNSRFIQTDAAINQGNSGGPMFDLNGNVIGINSQIETPNGGNVGLGFAIPSEVAAPIINTLKGGAAVRRGYLGVQIQQLDEGIADSLGLKKNQGELVASVVPGGAAARAGIRQGDVIAKVNNVDVTPDQTLSFIVAGLPVNARVPIEVIRNGQHQTLVATLAERPSEEKLAAIGRGNRGGGLGDDGAAPGQQASKASLGLALQSLTPEINQQLGVPEATRGVVVVNVDPESDAATKGLQRGDIIVSVNQLPVTAPAQVSAAVASARASGRSNVLLSVQRGNTPAQYVAVKLVSDK